ncbi:type I-F CRISPR-associated protein Csy1 [Photobacterium iliopiscarium]|uniref:type I-F CRISPR-associated protein Csy1 n=1 Tax=Photobacterium iliopiscarium TaxID=56192 RepID=UPI001E3D1708|nr:type I-F CRISPR-associated protein Csy1 [Photobacterium iliopiscarium]MCD9465678.1 type I-F CRISPR-associated protein Csy1 [Photobacterium iliopiscarium]MCD9485621.1 type I-F CRISPR-associated protein Csy1 [Photobacterium iliopiscarium]MCF2242318.1 type I-F CRISPR-associated protein Csy1 [Photobacterium iliopiscarium]
MQTEISTLIQAYIEQRRQTKLDEIEKKKNVKNGVSEIELATLNEQIQTAYQDFDIQIWLTSAAVRAKQISLATHAVKFTHGSAKGSNILALASNTDAPYLDSSAIVTPAVDAVGNAAALDVAKLLQLDDGNATLAVYLSQGDDHVLRSLASSDEQCQLWADGLRQALEVKTPSSHTLAKQIYFPIGGDNQYHLISPLYSSALAHELFHQVQHSRFSDEMKAARDARKKNQPSDVDVVRYSNLAVTISGGSKPQNISQLNSKRYGKTYLFPCTAPDWKSQYQPPMFGSNWFDSREVGRDTYYLIKLLAEFLVKVKLLDSNIRIRQRRDRLADQILDSILTLAVSHQTNTSGWSETSELSQAQQCWLDPQAEHLYSGDWQTEISRDFGLWLNNRLEKASQQQLMLGSEALQYWQALCHDAIREAGR